MVFFLSPSFGQTPVKSKHPLLDKYYPELRDKNKKPIAKPAEKDSFSRTAIDSTKINNTASTKALTKANQISAPGQLPAPKPGVYIPPVPGIDTSAITTSAKTSQKMSGSKLLVADKKPVINKMKTAAIPVPSKTRTQVTPPEGYRDTRLGSSSPLYNNYDKNKKGAGSVTTSPKG